MPNILDDEQSPKERAAILKKAVKAIKQSIKENRKYRGSGQYVLGCDLSSDGTLTIKTAWPKWGTVTVPFKKIAYVEFLTNSSRNDGKGRGWESVDELCIELNQRKKENRTNMDADLITIIDYLNVDEPPRINIKHVYPGWNVEDRYERQGEFDDLIKSILSDD